MKKWLRNSSLTVLLLAGSCVKGQDIPIGTWRTHFSYQSAHILETTSEKLFCATENGFFSYQFSDGSIEIRSKINGFSDTGIKALRYDQSSETLIIGYRSGLIDLVRSKKIKTVTLLKESTLDFDKAILDLETRNDVVYAANGLGVLVIAQKTGEIIDNYRSIGPEGIDLAAYELAISQESLYVLSNIGILKGDLEKNLLDFNSWELIAADTASYRQLVTMGSELFLVQDGLKVNRYDGVSWKTAAVAPSKISQLRVFENKLWLSTDRELFSVSGSDLISELLLTSGIVISDFIVNDQIWLATNRGLKNASGASFSPNGLMNDGVTRVKYLDRKVFAFYGPEATDFDGSYDSLGYDVFDGLEWAHQDLPDFSNIVDVAQINSNLYFASSGHGIYSSSEGKLNASNSPIGTGLDGFNTLISALKSDGNRLTATAFNHQNTIFQLDKAGNWTSFSSSDVGTIEPKSMCIAETGVVWMINGNNGVVAFDPSITQSKAFYNGQGLPSRKVNSMAVSVNDEVWLGTTNGSMNYPVASFPFEGFQWIEPFFENEPLFENEAVTAIATDGGDRVWMAAQDKLWVFNSSFSRRDHLFTTENSPLPSGTIRSLEYNPTNGEMYINTANGLVSYRSNSSNGLLTHRNVKIFPNPVRPEFSGEVGIKGVYADAQIKVADMSGKKIAELTANGGTASWNLRDFNGRKVESGVYFFFSSSYEGDDTYIGKIAVIR